MSLQDDYGIIFGEDTGWVQCNIDTLVDMFKRLRLNTNDNKNKSWFLTYNTCRGNKSTQIYTR